MRSIGKLLAVLLTAVWLLHGDYLAAQSWRDRGGGSRPPYSRGRGGYRPQPPSQPSKSEGEDKDKSSSDDKSDDKGDDNKDNEKTSEESKTDVGPPPVQRPERPSQPPNPAELEALPGEDGRVRFNFTGQSWPDVLQWLADVSEMSLDWQEAPGGYLNLTTRREYTLDEARDLINRHLLARGFTMLRNGEMLSVVKLDNLDPGMVPRVAVSQLDQRDPHEVVKVSFPLARMTAEAAVEELKPMMSPKGKLTALKATNRIEAVDVVVNLRELSTFLGEEQSVEKENGAVREFILRHARASEVREQLLSLLGLSSGSGEAEQVQRMIAWMRSRGGDNNDKSRSSRPSPGNKSNINLVANHRKNSIIASAPQDKMALIEEAIALIDVAPQAGNSLLANINRMQIYRLAAIDPKPLVETLEEVGNLDVNTRLEVDEKNKAIIAYATLADHVTIRALVEKLDGSGRVFEVIQLRRLEADYVAGTIEFMMVGEEEKQSTSSYGYGYSRYSSYYGRPSQTKEDEGDKFRVDADVANNRLLLWANDVELQEIRKLLVKLGEIHPPGGNPETVRVIETHDAEATKKLLERIRNRWSSAADNELIITETEEAKEDSAEDKSTGEQPAEEPAQKNTTASPRRSPFRFAQLSQEEQTPAAEEPAEEKPPVAAPPIAAPPVEEPAVKLPPVKITQKADGRLVISSEDTIALDLLEDMLTELAPRPPDYKIFRLKHAYAYGVALNLEEIFLDDDESGGFSWFRRGSSDEDEPSRLSKRKPLKFVADPDSNSILVQGADARQLKDIEDLIKFYDQPEATDSESVRRMQVFTLKYAQSQVVANAVKEVYRDLLSANDKAMQGQRTESRSSRYTYVFGNSDSNDGQKAPRFKGLLSLGFDQTSNTLVVSAPAYLLTGIAAMIEALDQAAEPTSPDIRAVKVSPGMTAAQVQSALTKIIGAGATSRGNSGRQSSASSRNNNRNRSSSSNRSSRARSGRR